MNDNQFTSEALIKRADYTSSTYYMKLSELIDEDSHGVFCFVEGKNDMKYYYLRVKNTIAGQPNSIVCGTKSNVIQAHKEISNHDEMSQYTIRYFVDADYDDNSNVSNDIYVTESYSIENYYGMDDSVSQVLLIAYCLSENKELHKTLMTLYKEEKEKFLSHTLLFNAWYAALHQMEEWKNGLRISLEEHFPKELGRCDIGCEKYGDYALENISELYTEAPQIPSELVDFQKKRIEADINMRIRGKYVMQILCSFLQYINDGSEKKHRGFKLTGKHKIEPCAENILMSMSQFAYTPESLLKYIKTGKRKEY